MKAWLPMLGKLHHSFQPLLWGMVSVYCISFKTLHTWFTCAYLRFSGQWIESHLHQDHFTMVQSCSGSASWPHCAWSLRSKALLICGAPNTSSSLSLLTA